MKDRDPEECLALLFSKRKTIVILMLFPNKFNLSVQNVNTDKPIKLDNAMISISSLITNDRGLTNSESDS